MIIKVDMYTGTISIMELFACWVIFHAFRLSSADFLKKNLLGTLYKVSNGSDPDQWTDILI